jgi:hypothetical protein
VTVAALKFSSNCGNQFMLSPAAVAKQRPNLFGFCVFVSQKCMRSIRICQSPVILLVKSACGLFVSFSLQSYCKDFYEIKYAYGFRKLRFSLYRISPFCFTQIRLKKILFCI